ncbi:hypothetical protein F5Y07DRAFT_65735 [Xylaria sp. FL0933]|nr:hypothetical protein F5Y07DRAFT_65735 [Xylaria sp. FL0933]
MPYSDNMYSTGDDSDGADYADQLSPSDGQFPSSSSNETPHVPNILIPDPAVEERAKRRVASKAQEADEERLLNAQANPSPRAPDSSFRLSSRLEQAATATSESPPHRHREITSSQTSASQSSSRVFAGRAWSPSVYSEAPPAYSPSPIPSGSSSERDRPRTYNTFGIGRIMGTPGVESERLLGSQPESMSAPVDEGSSTPTWTRNVRRRLPAWFSWKYALLALAVLIGSIVVLSGITSTSSPPKKGNDSTERPALPIDKEPETQMPDGSDSPGLPIQEGFCQGIQHHYDDQILSVDFDKSRNLSFKETLYKHSGSTSVRVGGQLVVRRLTEGAGDPRIVVKIVTNEPDLRLYTSLDGDIQEVKVSLPETYESSVSGQRPCVEVKGTIWVPENAEIGILSIEATHLDIMLFDDLSLRVADYTDIYSVIGGVTAGASETTLQNSPDASASNPDYTFIPAKDSWAFDSRVIEIHTTSGSINGNWPLFDLLGLHTTSGSITASITPKEELKHHPKPAVLSLSTISGSITATEPVHELYLITQRDYLVDVKSTSGSIHSALAFSSGITVHSTSGALGLDLLPVINIRKITATHPAQLETIATSGSIEVDVLEPMFYDNNGRAKAAVTASRVLDCLDATHKSTSGRIGLRYPQSWEGTLVAETTSGRLDARGKDLKIIRSSSGWPGSKMEARKGSAGKKSNIYAHAILGSLEAIIGDEF